MNYYFRDGKKVQCGMTGHLYALADLEDKKEIGKLTAEASSKYDSISSYGNFAIRDNHYYIS
jgi:hypothetical protein